MTGKRLKLTSDASFIQKIEKWAQESGTLEIESGPKEEIVTELGFDIATMVSIVTIVTSLGQLAVKIYENMKKDKKSKVVVQTSSGEIIITWSSDLKINDVKNLLEGIF